MVNCAGMDGGRLAGDDNEMYPIRGILLKVDAPWQKHFLMRDFITFTIPTWVFTFESYSTLNFWITIKKAVFNLPPSTAKRGFRTCRLKR